MSVSLAAPSAMPVRIIETKLIQKGMLVASLTIGLGRMILHEVQIFSANGTVWVNPPRRQQIGPGGLVVKGADGKVRWLPVVEWGDRDSKQRFQEGVISAFEAQHGPVAALAGRA